MEERPLILFGSFTEEETHLFFSGDKLKSGGVEFPDELPPFEKFVCDPNLVIEQSNEQGSVGELENEDDRRLYDENHLENELGTESTVEYDEVNQDSEINQVVNETSELTLNDSLPDPVSQSNEQSINHDDNSQLEEQVTTDQKAAITVDVSKPNNVVTVSTKTIMTNTTSVRSGHQEPVKSSWADLFKTKPSSKPQAPLTTNLQTPKATESDASQEKDQFRNYLVDILKKIELTYQTPHLQPRGLKNNANWCYINATLQVLLYCPSFYHFLTEFKLKTARGKSSTPILDALVLFASQFTKMPSKQPGGKGQEWNKQDVMMGMPFEPTYIYDLLGQIKTTLSQQGKQEDAEEFLSCILNGLHEEMVQLGTNGDKQESEVISNDTGNQTKVERNEESSGEWEQVGPRNKSTTTRRSMMGKSPVANMFGGYLRSSLLQQGVKESASIQPFYSIQLDLRGNVTTVQQAFDHFFSIEEVEGFQCDKSKMEVEVSKKWTLDSLPVVLVLHLKRFVVNKNGCEKLTKKISYESELHIPPDTISKLLKIRNKNMLTYKLFAVTYHHGKNLNGGHYTSDTFHPAVGWLRADDVTIRTIPTKFVFNPLSNRDPYLLYYRRGDISV